MKEISYMPVGRVKRRKKDWCGAVRELVANAAIVLVIGVLIGTGFGAGLAMAAAWL